MANEAIEKPARAGEPDEHEVPRPQYHSHGPRCHVNIAT